MRDRPDAARLLEQARATLLSELLEALPGDKRYTALMVANALAIAQREIAGGEMASQGESDSLRALLSGQDGEELGVLEQRLATEIRAGRHDGNDAVHQSLLESCVRRLRITNPKHLAREGFDD